VECKIGREGLVEQKRMGSLKQSKQPTLKISETGGQKRHTKTELIKGRCDFKGGVRGRKDKAKGARSGPQAKFEHGWKATE